MKNTMERIIPRKGDDYQKALKELFPDALAGEMEMIHRKTLLHYQRYQETSIPEDVNLSMEELYSITTKEAIGKEEPPLKMMKHIFSRNDVDSVD